MPRISFFHIFLFLFFSIGFFARAQVVRYDTKVKIIKDRKIIEKSFLINIKSRDDLELAEIEIEVQNSQEFKLLEASVFDASGERVRKLKNRDLVTRSNLSYESFFNDDVVKEFELFWNDFPYQIKYAYRIVEYKFVSVANWYPLVDKDVSVQRASLQVVVPSDYPLSMDFSDLLQYKVTENEDVKTMVWEIRDYRKPEKEMFAPHVLETIPHVSVFPQYFKYGVEGRADSWASFGAWFDSLNEGSLMLTVREKMIVDKLLEDIHDKKEIVKTLYHYLQDNVRYVNVRLDIGGLKSFPAQYVCQKKYGDCKALTTYMKALLNYVGIASNYVLVRGGFDVPRINKKLPGQQFNHVFLAVPMRNDTIWLENTSGTVPFNYLGSSLQNRKALFVDGDRSKLVDLPAMTLDDVYEERVFEFSLDEGGNGAITINQELRGSTFEMYRSLQKSLNPQEQEREIKNGLNTTYLDLNSFSFLSSDRDDHQLKILVEASCKNLYRQVANMKIIHPPVLHISTPEEPHKRRNPIRVPIPVHKSDSIIYNLAIPDHWEVQLPADTLLDTPFGKYETRYLKENKKLVVVNKFQLFQGEYPVEDYEAFYSFFSEIDKTGHQAGIIISIQ